MNSIHYGLYGLHLTHFMNSSHCLYVWVKLKPIFMISIHFGLYGLNLTHVYCEFKP